MVGDSRQKIVRYWTDPYAPTGEGERYQTEDGRVWKSDPTVRMRSMGTGESRGCKTNEHIKEKP